MSWDVRRVTVLTRRPSEKELAPRPGSGGRQPTGDRRLSAVSTSGT
jgi:hypothetical protein